ncbi:hypothetical protein [Pedobacter jeongneungensis]|uniref:hypothetical protein n=1 Tax=Pedobacter jeongneungensis TaxID=947309 RepID=UPI000469CC8B|nr:hypothetical protein [Pedobacter jeongneungensis]
MQPPEQIDYKELYEQARQDNILIREDLRQLRAMNEQLLHRVEQLLKLSFGSKSERYLGREQTPGQLRLGLTDEVTVEVIVPEPSKAITNKPQQAEKEKKKHFVIPETLVDEVQEIHP